MAPYPPVASCEVHYYVSDGNNVSSGNYPSPSVKHARFAHSSDHHPHSGHLQLNHPHSGSSPLLAFSSGGGIGGGSNSANYSYPSFEYDANHHHPAGAYAHFTTASNQNGSFNAAVASPSSPHFIAVASSTSVALELKRRKMISGSPVPTSWRSSSPWDIAG